MKHVVNVMRYSVRSVLLGGGVALALWLNPGAVRAQTGDCLSTHNGVCIANSYGNDCPSGSMRQDDKTALCAPSEHCCAFPAGKSFCADRNKNCFAGSCPTGWVRVNAGCLCSGANEIFCLPVGPPPECDGQCPVAAACNPDTQVPGFGFCRGSGTICCKAKNPGPTPPGPTPPPVLPPSPPPPMNPTPSAYENPLTSSDLIVLLTQFLSWMQGFVVVLAIVFLIIGALLYLTSGGSEKQITWAKAAILAAMIGLALVIAAPLFLREIGIILGWVPSNLPNFGTPLTFTQVLGKILSFLLGIIGVVSIIMLVIGGFAYLTSAGDANRADTGKSIVTYAVVGIAVTLAALVIIRQVAAFFV